MSKTEVGAWPEVEMKVMWLDHALTVASSMCSFWALKHADSKLSDYAQNVKNRGWRVAWSRNKSHVVLTCLLTCPINTLFRDIEAFRSKTEGRNAKCQKQMLARGLKLKWKECGLSVLLSWPDQSTIPWHQSMQTWNWGIMCKMTKTEAGA